ncbi:zeta toxin family protein [Nocardiopsis alba]|uniref:zeta toxin family protein n=1 Tax=Nocardiopsis alba TaxID=53437 RepID=UPI0033F42FC0
MSFDWTIGQDEKEIAVQRRIDDITPLERPDRGAYDRPRAIILGGQPGVGKSTTQDDLVDGLGRSSTASYDGDDNSKFHPFFKEIARSSRFEGYDLAGQMLPANMHRRCMDHLRAGSPKYDVVASHPLGRKEWAESWVRGFSDEGYHTSVAFVASHESNSLLGIADRYQTSRDERGYGRWVGRRWHDDFYRNIPEVAHDLESRGLVDSIYVTNRDGRILYENHRGSDGRMRDPLGARDTIKAERDRQPTAEETERFESRVSYLEDPNRLGPEKDAEPLHSRVRETVEEAKRRHGRHLEESRGKEGPEISETSIPEALREARDRDRALHREEAPQPPSPEENEKSVLGRDNTISAIRKGPQASEPRGRSSAREPSQGSESSPVPTVAGQRAGSESVDSTDGDRRSVRDSTGSSGSSGRSEPEPSLSASSTSETGSAAASPAEGPSPSDIIDLKLQRIREAREAQAARERKVPDRRRGPVRDLGREDPGLGL